MYMFFRFGIEAITLEGYEKKGRGYMSVLQVGRYVTLFLINTKFYVFSNSLYF